MKHFIIGTAGHIDHGKTSLIRALTGRNTDRLEEETRRGITIDLGFTYYDDPNTGIRVGIIDVPGHEKFVTNMLSGVHGMDMVLLVIAADEGIMPQTIEHINILDLLGVKEGIVVITKSDMVDKDWLELVVDDVKDQLSESFLKDSPVVVVSSKTNEGIDELKEMISKKSELIEDITSDSPGIIPIDRVFVLKGIGTVITGTQIEGTFEVNQDIYIYPENIESKIRSIQVHGEDTDKSYSSQRVAINLNNVKKDDISRGSVISVKDHLLVSRLIDVKMKVLKDSLFTVKNKSRVRFHVASKETFARVNLLDRDELKPGEECFCQLQLEEEIVARREDKFIIRFFSPVITIGGGEILEVKPKRKRRFREEGIKLLEDKAGEDLSKTALAIIKEHGNEIEFDMFTKSLNVSGEESIKLVEELEDNGLVVFVNNIIVAKDYIVQKTSDIIEYLEKFHDSYPLTVGVPIEEIRARFFKGIETKNQDTLIQLIINDSEIERVGNVIKLTKFVREYTEAQNKQIESIKELMSKEYRTYKKDELGVGMDLIAAIIFDKILVELDGEVLLYSDLLKAQDDLVKLFNSNEKIDVKMLRDALDTNRKTAVALLEYFDSKKVTKRVGDERILIKKGV